MSSSQHSLNRRSWIAGGVMLVGFVASRLASAPRGVGSTHFNLDSSLPRAFAGWRMADADQALLPDPDEAKAVTQAYEEAVSRTYLRGTEVMMVVVAHGRSDSGLLALHRAETCYTSQGFAVQQKGQRALPAPFGMVMATGMFAERNDRIETILYWASIAGEQSGTNVEQKLRLLRAAWQGRDLDAFMVRASNFGEDNEKSFSQVGEFLQEMLSASPTSLRRLLAAGH